MLKEQEAIGNYFENPNQRLDVPPQARETMVKLIEELQQAR
jgi:hypothetical protein